MLISLISRVWNAPETTKPIMQIFGFQSQPASKDNHCMRRIDIPVDDIPNTP
jgi:hypothetical protein